MSFLEEIFLVLLNLLKLLFDSLIEFPVGHYNQFRTEIYSCESSFL